MRFSLKTLLLVMTSISAVMALIAYDSVWLMTILGVVVAMNLFGAVAAVGLNKFLGFPVDGGYRDPAIRAEMMEKEAQENSNSQYASSNFSNVEKID